MAKSMISKKAVVALDKDIPKLALMIGIGYNGTRLEISDPYDDLHRFAKYLENIGYENDNIIILTDSSAFNNKASPTYINILTYIDDLVKFADENKGSYITLYYTGHGSRFKERDKIREAIVPSNYDEAHCIKGEVIKKLLVDRLDPTTTLFCMIDCCYSGNIISLKNKYLGRNKYLNNIHDESKCRAYVLGSSKKDQKSLKQLIDMGKQNREKRSLTTWAFYDKYRANSTLLGLVINMQILLNSRSKNAQHIQLLSNQDIDTSKISIPRLA